MAEHTVKTYSCDRCGTNIGNARRSNGATVTAHKKGEWAMELQVEWKDLCEPCETEVVAFFKRRP